MQSKIEKLKDQLDLVVTHRQRIKDRIQWLRKQIDLDVDMIRRLDEDRYSLTRCADRLRDQIRNVSG